MSQDVFDDCERFDDHFEPLAPRKPGLEVLPDGAYDFAILGAVADRTEKTRDPIVRVLVRVLGGQRDGQEAEWLWWLTRQEGVDRIGGDLATLGFDTHSWKAPARPFSRELAKVLPRLQGLRFRGRILRSKDGQYTNLYCDARLSGSAPPPPPATTPPVAPVAPTVQMPAGGMDSDLPF